MQQTLIYILFVCVCVLDVDVRDPDEKSIMTYVAQFLQYSRDTPASEEDMQVELL